MPVVRLVAPARGSEAHPHLAGGSGIAIGGVGGPLLVGGQYVVYFILVVIQFIIEIQDGPARIAEDGVHLLLQQALQDGLGGSYFQTAASFGSDRNDEIGAEAPGFAGPLYICAPEAHLLTQNFYLLTHDQIFPPPFWTAMTPVRATSRMEKGRIMD